MMMSERLRRNAKWVFALLAIVFAASFVLGSVGNSGGLSITDWFSQKSNSSNAPKSTPISDELKAALATAKTRPKDPKALDALGDAWLARSASGSDQRTQAADVQAGVTAYEQAAKLAPKDTTVLQKLADGYTAQAAAASAKVQALSQQAQELQAGTSGADQFTPGGVQYQDPFSKATDARITDAVSKLYTQLTPLQTAATSASTKALAVYRKLTAANPSDAKTWYGLAVAAESANDLPTAIKGYEQFLKLQPGDPVSDQIKQHLDELKKQQNPPATTTATTPATTSP
jgi:tetratricopeptide (TPR) repeat protein